MDSASVTKLFDRIVEFAGVGAFIDTPVKRYSSGMLARLGFSVAAHLDAEILLIDEVFGVGDVEFQKRSYERLRELRASGAAILFVTHNLFAVSQVAERAICLRHGRVVDSGSVDEVLVRYRTSYAVSPVTGRREERSAYFERASLPGSARSQDTVRLEGTLVVEKPVRNGRVHVTIATPDGIDVLSTASEELSQLLSREGRWDFQAVLGPLSLAPKTYRIWLSIAEDDRDIVYVHDQVNGELTVETDVPFGYESEGVLVTPIHWSYQEVPMPEERTG
jgi:ABC-type multidrug transport system ATPase subunit